jgi:hypothetical protein
MNRDFIWRELHGGLWHTTHPDRFRDILTRGAIIPEPDIPNSERWKASKGPEFYPYVRTLGGVSLFDFNNFEPESYSREFRVSNWHDFVSFRKDWGCAVWIEIDRVRAAHNFVSTTDLVGRQNDEKAFRHTIMPHLEAAYIGELPRTAFVRAFVVRQGEQARQAVDIM